MVEIDQPESRLPVSGVSIEFSSAVARYAAVGDRVGSLSLIGKSDQELRDLNASTPQTSSGTPSAPQE